MEKFISDVLSKDINTGLNILKMMFDSLSDYIFIMKEDRKTNSFIYLYANKIALENLDLDETIYGKSLVQVLPQKRANFLRLKYIEAAKTDKTTIFEDYFRNKNGMVIGETALNPIKIEDRKEMIIFSIVRDITVRKEREYTLIKLKKEMEKNQQRMKSLIDQNPDLVYELDLNGHFLSVNTTTEKVLGFSQEEFIGKSFKPFIVPEDREKISNFFQNAVKGNPEEYEIYIFNKKGEKIFLQISNIPILVDGKIDGVYGIAKDITDKKKMEENLLASEERYRTLFDFSPEPILLLRDMKIIFCNRKALELLGVDSLAQVQGMNALEMIHPTEQDMTKQRNHAILNGENLISMDRRITTPKGKELIIEMTGKMVNFEGEPAMLVSSRDVTERKKAEEKANYLAYHDELTGLGNRRLFKSGIKDLIQQAKEKNQKFAVMILDLDNFKRINDMYGHDVGDEVLVAVSSRLKSILEKSVIITRQGGDEIGIICPNTYEEDGTRIANNIQKNFSIPIKTKNYMIQVNVSIGIAFFPIHGEDDETLIKHTDIALYHVKNVGKKGWTFYSAEIGKGYKDRLNLESKLKDAIKNQQFSLHYQPRIDAKTEKMTSVEALIRWSHASPSVFIPIAEDTGMINQIGEWVTRNACIQMKKWIDKGYPIKKMSVNLSVHQLLFEDNCLKRIEKIINDTGLPPKFLEFEITEHFISYEDHIISCLQKIKKLGITFSIDDFGKEYSSLWCIKNLPVQTIKLDRSFINEINNDKESNAIIEAIISLANILNLKVVGEGVETKEQAEFLKQIGVDELQGYWFSKALPANELEELFLKD